MPLIDVEISKERKVIQAFLDTGADDNIISYELFKCLNDIQLVPTSVHFQDYSGHLAPAFGCCVIKMFVQGLTCEDEFFVTHPTLQTVPMILGRAWQQQYNCSINWANQSVSCTINESQTSVKLHQPVVMSLIQPNSLPQTGQDTIKTKASTVNKDLSPLQPITSSPTLPSKGIRLSTHTSLSLYTAGKHQQRHAQRITQGAHTTIFKWIPKAQPTTMNATAYEQKVLNNHTLRVPTAPREFQHKSQVTLNSRLAAYTWKWVRKDVLQSQNQVPQQ